MPTRRTAADLLTAANTAGGRRAVAALLGFTSQPLTLDTAARRRLGLPLAIQSAALVEGTGCLRALLVDAPDIPSVRELLGALASSIGARSPHVLWIAVVTTTQGAEVGIGTWFGAARGQRVVALAVQRTRVVASDAETLLALAASGEGQDLLVHARWCELLGREALSRRFYRVLEHKVQSLAESAGCASATEARELALLYVSRLLFLSFLETKGWLNGDRAFLARQFDECMTHGGRFHHRVLLPLFFGTLNTRARNRAPAARRLGAIPFLNGGLFTPTALERRHTRLRFGDDAFGALFGDLLGAYRFTARESDDLWHEASVDPEMLGRSFESLMAARERRTSGAFYTPQELVSHVTASALARALSGGELTEECIHALLNGSQPPATQQLALRERLRGFTVLDPACGSGAFLVHVLERVADLHRMAGDTRDLASIRRDVLATTIYGADVNPTAVWLCELRLWLSVVMESNEARMSAVPPLPNLDCNVRVGDSLSGTGFREPPALTGPPAALARLHARYVRASGPAKAPLRRSLAREERRRALAVMDRELLSINSARRERLIAQRSADLFGERSPASSVSRAEMRDLRNRAAAARRERRRIADGGALPFSFPSHFASVHARGGFHLVIGNPPWVRLHNIPPAMRGALRAQFTVYRDAAWAAGVQGARGSTGFSSQVDMASLFVERAADLAAPTGCVALLVPAKLWRSLAGGGTRRLLAERLHLGVIEDWSAAPACFDAAVYPALVIATRHARDGQPVRASVRIRGVIAEWRTTAADLRLVASDPASPLLLLPPAARAGFDHVSRKGIAMHTSSFGAPMLGVKCGCNDAFVVAATGERGNEVDVEHQGRRGVVDRQCLRPLLRGEAVTAWSVRQSRNAIVWTHDDDGAPLAALPGATARWLAPWKRQLSGRSDLRGSGKWWMLFRTASADSAPTRVVWSDFGRRPRATVLAAGNPTVPLNTCYVVPCADRRDALALCALINTPVAAAWLNAIAEPARGGWHRYLAWTVALLPIPHDWDTARSVLAPLAERALAGAPPTDDELIEAARHAYHVRRADLEPLLEWSHQLTSG